MEIKVIQGTYKSQRAQRLELDTCLEIKVRNCRARCPWVHPNGRQYPANAMSSGVLCDHPSWMGHLVINIVVNCLIPGGLSLHFYGIRRLD